MSNEESKFAHVINAEGAPMMTMQRMGREGDRMVIEGSLMGAWASVMYMEPEEMWPMIKLLLKWQVIGYMCSLPFILIKRRIQKKDK